MSNEDFKYRHDYKKFTIDRTFRPIQEHPDFTSPHIHGEGEFLLVLEGSSTVVADGNVFQGEGRYLIYVPAGCIHEQINDRTSIYTRYCFSFSPEYTESAEYLLPNAPFLIDLNNERFESVYFFVSALHKFCASGEDKGFRLKHLLLLFLNELRPMIEDYFVLTERKNVTRGRKKYISDVCAYINLHCTEGISIDKLSEHFFVSRSKLTRDFKTAMKLPIGDYISLSRIDKSLPMLADGLPISEIAQRCGFSSPSYYIHCFRQRKGCTPMKYKDG